MNPQVAQALHRADAEYIIGLDEVGTGAWFGPATVGAVVSKWDWEPGKNVRDSKQLSRHQRGGLVEAFLVPPNIEDAWVFHIGVDEFNNGADLKRALERTFTHAISLALERYPKAVAVVDGLWAPKRAGWHCMYMPKADNIVPACSAASIIAKVARDTYVIERAKKYPGYGLETHVGYGTAQHRNALQRLGPTPEHRTGFKPIQQLARTRAAAMLIKQQWPQR